MATNIDITENILNSINTALQKTDLTEDQRGLLINQFEQITDMVRDGYQFSDTDLLSLPDAIRSETSTILNSEIATFTASVQTLINTISMRSGFGSLAGRIHLPSVFAIGGIAHTDLHMKTNIPADRFVMYHISFKGMMYSQGLIDSSISFFISSPNILISKFISNSQLGLLDCYVSSDGFIVLRFSHPSTNWLHGIFSCVSAHSPTLVPFSVLYYVANNSTENQF